MLLLDALDGCAHLLCPRLRLIVVAGELEADERRAAVLRDLARRLARLAKPLHAGVARNRAYDRADRRFESRIARPRPAGERLYEHHFFSGLGEGPRERRFRPCRLAGTVL